MLNFGLSKSPFMHCKELSLINFKNYQEATLEFSEKFNCFAGNNGAGKTNVLDAIYYLSFCKSFSNPVDSQNIRFEEDFFVVQGKYQVNGQEDDLYCGLKRNQRKVFKRNKKEYDRLSDHIGAYPLVLLSPADTQLILGGSEDRRKFIDGVISQYNKEYLQRLLTYNRALQQRNTLLKVFAEKRRFDEASLEIWDEQLIQNGVFILKERILFFREFLPVFNKYYAVLSGDNEVVNIEYLTAAGESNYREKLVEARQRDRIAQYTTMGIHKDELSFLIHDNPVKKFGSQGQQKSFIIALKLAQFVFTKEVKGFNPILLFDDVFDKLDADRVQHLMQLVSKEDFGQVFVSDTHASRIEKLFKSIGAECRIFIVEDGSIARIKTIKPKS